MIKDKTTTGPPSTSSRSRRFLACFGYSGEKNMQLVDKVNSTSRRRGWLSDWSFSCKKSDVKTVPRKPKSINKTPGKKSGTILEIPVDGNRAPVASEEQKPSRKKWTEIVKLQNGGKEMIPAATSATGAGLKSPEKRTVTIAQSCVSSPLKPLTQSKSLPVLNREKPTKAALTGVDDVVLHKTTSLGGEFDSLIAMLILLVILVIMVVWGKLCAIFCACAWFFIVPRLVGAGEYAAEGTAERRLPEAELGLNLESVEYKKKVVMEGLLQRNNRNVVGRL